MADSLAVDREPAWTRVRHCHIASRQMVAAAERHFAGAVEPFGHSEAASCPSLKDHRCRASGACHRGSLCRRGSQMAGRFALRRRRASNHMELLVDRKEVGLILGSVNAEEACFRVANDPAIRTGAFP